jgi:hypothetical protein
VSARNLCGVPLNRIETEAERWRALRGDFSPDICEQIVHGIAVLDTLAGAPAHLMEQAGRDLIGSHKRGSRGRSRK